MGHPLSIEDSAKSWPEFWGLGHLQRKRRKLSYIATTQPIVDSGTIPSSTGLQVFVHGKQVDRVFVSRVIVWNSGDETVDRTDIETIDPIRILVPNGEILHAELDKSTRSVNNVRVSLKGEAIPLDFDYLDPRDGFRIAITHGGNGEKPILVGEIKGLPNGILHGRVRRTKRWTVVGTKIPNLIDLANLTLIPAVLFLAGISDLFGPELHSYATQILGEDLAQLWFEPSSRNWWRGLLMLVGATVFAFRFFETFGTKLKADLIDDLN